MAKRYIEFEKRKCQNLTLRVSPQTSFQYILARMNEIKFVGCDRSTEHIVYSILELLNNSLRAHRNKNVKKPILLEFKTCSAGFEVLIQDWGGGFDVRSLPYNLNSDPDEINIHDAEFEKYRQINNYKKFGLGLYLARKTFPYFDLNFFDAEQNETQWTDGGVVGTRIRLRTSAAEPKYMDFSETEVLYEKQENI